MTTKIKSASQILHPVINPVTENLQNSRTMLAHYLQGLNAELVKKMLKISASEFALFYTTYNT